MSESAVFISSPAENRIDHDVFISYSRRDTDFAKRLLSSLKEQNRDTWIDWQSVQAAEDFWQAIEIGIEATNTFVFILSSDSIISDYCNREIDHAVKYHKRLVPIVCSSVEPSKVHSALRSLNWIDFSAEGFEPAFQRLVKAIDTDLSYTRTHTRLLVKAIEWYKRGRDDSFLLRRSDLSDAESWLNQSSSREPVPTNLQQVYISISREAEDQYNQLLARGRRAQKWVKVSMLVVPIAVAIPVATALIVHADLAQKQRDIRDVWQFSNAEAEAIQGHYDNALNVLSQVIEKNPHNTFAIDGRGYVYGQMRNYPKAEAEFRQAIRIDSNDATAWYGLGLALRDQHKLDEAIENYRKAIQLDPKYAGAYSNLSNALRKQHKLDEAIENCRKAIQLDPKDAYAYNNLGLALYDQHKLDEAIENFRRAIQLDSKLALAYDNLGTALLDQHKLDEALTALNQALELDPSMQDAKTLREQIQQKMKR